MIYQINVLLMSEARSHKAIFLKSEIQYDTCILLFEMEREYIHLNYELRFLAQ